MIMNASKFAFDDDESNVNHVTFFDYICRLCKIEFYFNNKLHRHVRIYRKKRVNSLSAIESVKVFHEHFANSKVLSVVESTAIITFDVDLNFRK